ncbi:hypothetical protein ACI79D_09775 [Geodermatophilus sp. SYSU D00708]
MNRTLRTLTAGAAVAVALAGCGGKVTEDAEAGPTLPPKGIESTSAEPTPTGPQTNARGHIEKAIGEEGGITDEATDTPVITFAVDAIAPAQCTDDWEQYGSPAENGNLIAVSLRFATAPELANSDMASYFSVSSYDFAFIGPDGITVDNVDTMATYGCLPDGQEFTQNSLGPGQQYTGQIVLDVPAPNGTLVYRPSVLGGSGGWEWTF